MNHKPLVNTMKSYEQTYKELEQEVQSIIEADIEQYEDSTLENFHQDQFNSDFYIIGTYQAKEWLTEKDVFNCIDIVQEWEREVFGELQSDLSNPEKLASLVMYSVGERMLTDLADRLDIDYHSELTPENIKDILD